jgi:hypothetical protein
MRNGQNKRMRGRNRKSHNPLTRVYESNGPDVKIRGTASHVAEKYVQLARDAQASGDPVAAENYFQHAEHYFRMIAAAQEQFRQNNQSFGYRPEGSSGGGAADPRDENFDENDDDSAGQPIGTGEQPSFGTRDPQPYLPRDAQFFSPRDQHQQYGGRQQHGGPNARGERGENAHNDSNPDRLPSFITGGSQPQGQSNHGQQGHQGGHQQGHGSNGYDNQGGDRFPLHRRRRRHRGPRPDMQGGHQRAGSEGDED